MGAIQPPNPPPAPRARPNPPGVIASLPWAGTMGLDDWIKAVQEVVAQLHESNVHQTHKSGFCPSCAENYLACNLLAGKLDL